MVINVVGSAKKNFFVIFFEKIFPYFYHGITKNIADLKIG